MSAVALRTGGEIAGNDNVVSSLPAMVRRAASQLESATTAAEVLEAKATAGLAYDAAKAAVRFAKAKGAYDDVIGAVYRAQADALEIEAMAKRRFADEYDAGQRDGFVAKPGEWRERKDAVSLGHGLARDKLLASDFGLTRKEIQRFREVRDADDADPGVHGRVARELAERGQEPSKRAVGIEINTRLNSFSGDNEWYTPARYIAMAREVMGTIDVDPASNATAQRTINATTHYTEESNGLDKDWNGTVWMNPPYSNPEIQNFVDKVITEHQSGRCTEAVVLTNNSGDTAWHHALQDACSAMCIVKGRIRFESPTRASNSPAMGQAFFYFGEDWQRFKDVFSAIGNVWRLA